MALHPEILDRAPAEGARTVVLALLADTRDRADRLAAAVKEARLEAKTGRVAARGGKPGAGLRPGLLALEGLAGRRADRLFSRLRSEVLESLGSATLAPSLEVASALEARARGS